MQWNGGKIQIIKLKIQNLRAAAYLKSSHIPRVSSVFQTVLVAFEEELEEEPETKNINSI